MSEPVRQDYIPQELQPDSLVSFDTADEISTDVLIIGSGMGGSALAWALKDSGLDVLVAERGNFLPREPENSQTTEMYMKGRYKNAGFWYDGSTGKPFAPGVYYWVGGNTRFYGAMLPRFRRSDFTEVEHHEGVSHAWPFGYDDLEPFYHTMERLLQVHGQVGEDPTEPPHAKPYPHPALEHEPEIERFARSLRRQGLHPFHTPNALNVNTQADRAAVTTADGCPDETGMKSDAENRILLPALRDGVKLLTGAEVTRLLTAPGGRRVVAAEARHLGRTVRINAKSFAVAGGAVNSAALLLRSAGEAHPDGLGNSSGLLGRNYMVHNSTFFVGVNPLLICGPAYATDREMTLIFEMYAYANHNTAVATTTRSWLARSRESLALHFTPGVARALDALIESWPMHRRFDAAPLNRQLVAGVVHAVVSAAPDLPDEQL